MAQATPIPAESNTRGTSIGLTAVIVAVTDEDPRVLVARRMTHDLATPAQQGLSARTFDAPETLPFGPFEPQHHRTLELGLRQWVGEQTGVDLRYVEQLYTFGNQNRDPRELQGGPRVVSVAYLTLTQETPLTGTGEAQWRPWYSFLPWEDWRDGRPELIDRVIRPALTRWIDAAPDARSARSRMERTAIAFGPVAGTGHFDLLRCLDRYELLYSAGLAMEAIRDGAIAAQAEGREFVPPGEEQLAAVTALGHPMALDNRRILASALGRLRGKIDYRPVVFDLLPPEFTLLRLQKVVEALSGIELHKQNFRRTVMTGNLVEATGQIEATGRGRPAETYRFRRDVMQEKHDVGIPLPLPKIGG
ncbi:hypothetical protein D3874_11200 [Oleomonas cavernae]|uniref:NrtR DNA-binding winged helix domain-containing protein n=1 Tax=Oleomonas cavernae TaxID=2320859 RepID=A0A418WBX1_9PROT|nr:hypothetical protein [Oleomonas cavernae]RJF87515.1 hypothetical protein D3874_11200 [Oleomonas cavernae]